MAGIYIHIPFCKQACHYCDFHFSTQLSYKQKFLEALCKEIACTQGYLKDSPIETIYFGGGTPSLLSADELAIIMIALKKEYDLTNTQEITFEVNPEDYDEKKFEEIQKLGINRLSIGIQSFDENHLKWMNRSHSSLEALSCVKGALDLGFNNISIDLIYGIPSVNHVIWQQDLETASQLGATHLSAYCLTVEPKTTFGKWKALNKMVFSTDEFEAEQFEMLIQHTQLAGFEQYEISNFCKPNGYSRHNSNYWGGAHYLGLGPSAHSYDGQSRQWNESNNLRYIKAAENNIWPHVKEILTDRDKANEYIMTSIRTKWGTSIQKVTAQMPNKAVDFKNSINEMEGKNLITMQGDYIYLTSKGKLMGDYVSAELFI